MILLDTNILSELMRSEPAPIVGQWLRGLGDEPLATSVITLSEISYGLERLPDGSRKTGLWTRFEHLVSAGNGLALLPLTDEAALAAGRFRALRERQGLPASPSDMMIAGIAAVSVALLATRNTKDFAGLPLKVVNPWEA